MPFVNKPADLRTSGELAEATELGGWRSSEEPLDEAFHLVDLDGATWTPQKLRGKTVLINLWASWCIPCREEMPEIVRLHQRVKDRDDLIVLSLNMDHDPGLIAPFVREYGLEMPVLLGLPFLEKKFRGPVPIPQNWIVDPQGIVRYQQGGYTLDKAEGFVAEMLAKLESVAVRGGD